MRLFYQLDPEEQDNIIDHCVSIVLEDIIDNGLTLHPSNDEEISLKEKLDDAKEQIATMITNDEKMDHLMSDGDIADAVFEIATEMAKNAFYHEQDEMVFFPDAIAHEHEEEEPKLLSSSVNKKDLN